MRTSLKQRTIAHALESRLLMAVNNLTATADSYIRDGSFAASNFGSATDLIVKLSGTDFNRESLVKFDLGPAGANITSAKLRVFGALQDNRQLNVLTDVYGAAAGWTEAGVTWNNRPAANTAKLATLTVNNATGAWYEVDVTSFIQAEKTAGRNVVSLLLRNPATAAPYSFFKSKETATTKPVLVVTDDVVAALPVVGVSASDANASEPGSDTGTFTLTRTGSTAAALAVAYSVGGSASGGQDYAALSGTVTFAAGSSTATVAVNPSDDGLVEGPENVVLTLSAGGTYTIDAAKPSATVTIADNDTASSVQVTRTATADAYVRDGSFAGSNFGTATELVVKKSGIGFNREGFLKFDLTNLGGTVTGAKVRVFGSLQDNSGANVLTNVYGTGTSWTESGINWNNRPAITTAVLGSIVVVNATAKWYEVDVTAFVQAEQADARGSVALLLGNPASATPYTTFASRETSASKPQLVLTVDTINPPPPPNSGQTPYGGTPAAVPGRIEAETFDEGGEGIAYHDLDPANQGGAFRSNVGVDIELATDGGSAIAIGHVAASEWLEYTINVVTTGSYDLGIRFASGNGGGIAHLEVDGANVSGPVTLPGTGGWQNWITVNKSNLTLSQGQHVLRLALDSSAGGDVGNINWIQLTPTPPPAQPPRWPSSWQTAASAPTARFEAAGTVVGSKIFVFGGFKSDFTVHRTHMSYNTTNNTWTTLGTMPTTMAESHQGLAADDRYVYIAGGFGGNLDTSQDPTQWISDKVWRYDTVDNTFTQIATLPQARGAGGLDLVGRNLHYFGGNPADRVTNVGDHWVYNLDTGAWSTRAPMPDPKDHFSTAVLNGKIYAIGGEHGHDQLHQQESDLDVYDPATNTWTSLASMPIQKSHMEAGTFVLDGKIVMAGGQTHNFQPTANVIAYDPDSNSWATLPSLPAARQGAVVRAVGNAVYITLGGTQTNSPQSNTWVGQLPAALSASPSSASVLPAGGSSFTSTMSTKTSYSLSAAIGLTADETLDVLNAKARK